ncbi:MAG: hypothetical protein WD749_06230 [Phycisphaerales bacterium]
MKKHKPAPAPAPDKNRLPVDPFPAEDPSISASRGPDRRRSDAGSPTGLERRRGPGRRLSDFVKAAEEGEMTQEQFLFLMAIEGFKKANNKVYPSWTDVLEVLRLLGYRKTQASQISLRHVDDWTEAADAPADVRREPTPARKRRKAA